MLASLWGISDVFDQIVCLLAALANIILGAVVAFLNLLILAAAGWLAVLAVLLPSMPDAPSGPTPEVLQWVNWLFPLAQYVGLLSIMLTLWLAMIGIRAGLRFLRAL
jgi:hypothetical protein